MRKQCVLGILFLRFSPLSNLGMRLDLAMHDAQIFFFHSLVSTVFAKIKTHDIVIVIMQDGTTSRWFHLLHIDYKPLCMHVAQIQITTTYIVSHLQAPCLQKFIVHHSISVSA